MKSIYEFLNEGKKPVTDKFGWHIKPFFKEREKVLYYGEPATIIQVRDDGSKVTYDVSYDNKSGYQTFVANKSNEITKLNESLLEKGKFMNESEFTHNEKFWDRKFKKAIKNFPDWAQEKDDLTNSIRDAYNQLELDVIEGDKGYVKPLDVQKLRSMSKDERTKAQADFAKDLWNKLKGNEWAKQNALEDYLDWLK